MSISLCINIEIDQGDNDGSVMLSLPDHSGLAPLLTEKHGGGCLLILIPVRKFAFVF